MASYIGDDDADIGIVIAIIIIITNTLCPYRISDTTPIHLRASSHSPQGESVNNRRFTTS